MIMRRIENTAMKRADVINEYAILIFIVGLVFAGMNVYVKRSIQARAKDLTDEVIFDKHLAQINKGISQVNRSVSSYVERREDNSAGKENLLVQHSNIHYTGNYFDPDKGVTSTIVGPGGEAVAVVPYHEIQGGVDTQQAGTKK